MTKMTRFEPLRELFPFEPFRGFGEMLRTWPRLPMEGAPVADFKMDLTEDDAAYYVKAELPGMKKEDIAITVDGNLVTIAAEMKHEETEKDKAAVYTERTYGKVERSFTLRHELDEGKAAAEYDKGVLALTLPKRAGGGTKQVVVH